MHIPQNLTMLHLPTLMLRTRVNLDAVPVFIQTGIKKIIIPDNEYSQDTGTNKNMVQVQDIMKITRIKRNIVLGQDITLNKDKIWRLRNLNITRKV